MGCVFLLWRLIQQHNHLCSPSLLLGRIETVIEDFKLDMTTPTSSYMVGSCFVATETGTYFDGTGFLKAGEIPPVWNVVSVLHPTWNPRSAQD